MKAHLKIVVRGFSKGYPHFYLSTMRDYIPIPEFSAKKEIFWGYPYLLTTSLSVIYVIPSPSTS